MLLCFHGDVSSRSRTQRAYTGMFCRPTHGDVVASAADAGDIRGRGSAHRCSTSQAAEPLLCGQAGAAGALLTTLRLPRLLRLKLGCSTGITAQQHTHTHART